MTTNQIPHGDGTLAAWVTRQLREQIVTGGFKPGDKLPTQADLMRRYSVSRTVVREAASALHADGLVEMRHGVGVFVSEPSARPGGFKPLDRTRISSVIDMLELRAAIESEAAALAAERRSPRQEEVLYTSLGELSRLAKAGSDTVKVDFDFHLAVADASNNGRFREFLAMLGEHAIPRSVLGSDASDALERTYAQQIAAEHAAIVEAISARNPDGARVAMRDHLRRGGDRYRRLLLAL